MPYDSAHRMRRSKSAPSVRRRHPVASVSEPLNPDTARHHATKAASFAMTRAKDKDHAAYERRKSRSEDGMPPPSAPTVRRSSSIRFTQEAHLTNYHGTATSNASTKAPREAKGSDEQRLSADASTVSEFQGFANEDIFAPSSYRRLRKARSMFATKSMRTNRGSDATPSAQTSHIDYSSRQKSSETAADTHQPLRHSLSFFNGTSQTIRRAKSQRAMCVRPHISEEEDYPISQSHPSSQSGDGRLAQKSLRLTLRPMRELSPDDGDVLPASSGFHKKARSLSLNIRKRLKRVFGRADSVEDPLPEGPAFGSPYGMHTIADSPTTVGRTSPPILRSKQSFESIATSTSRVTSWSNSTAGNTIKAKSNFGCNHLSTIEEGGDTIIAQNVEMSDMHRLKQDRNRQGKQLDSQRVYSALMRHIGETASKDGERVLSSGTVKGYPVIAERSSSVQSHREARSVRQMASDVSMKTARTSFPVDYQPESPQSHSPYAHYLEPIRPSVTPRALTKGQPVAKQSSSSLREFESTFFPSSASVKPKTPSPYRMAMNSLREINDYDNDASSVIIKQSASARCVSRSPSIYSRTPSGCAISRDDLEHGIEEPVQSGMATIFDTQIQYRSPKKNTSSATNVRSKNSAEWKKWMDSQIQNITVFDAPTLSSPLDARNHHREGAECGEEPLRIDHETGDQNQGHAEGLRPRSPLTEMPNLKEEYELRLPTPITGRKVSSQNNFSRLLSRQSVTSFKTADRSSVGGNVMSRLYEDPGKCMLSNRQEFRSASAEAASRSARSIDLSNSPSRRLAIKAAREARLNRSPGGLSTVQQVDDAKDAKDIQFRSIRGSSDYYIRNKENETSPTIQRKDTSAAGLASLSELHKTIDSKRMVDIFLDSRRAREETPEHDEEAPAFI